ncbi:MAG: YitT family protein [Paludibacteraceae bacterium]|nr:YitT family protein [Paludibacteraceae bacterium]
MNNIAKTVNSINIKDSSWKILREHVMICIGLLIYAISWKFILLPHHIVGGGATGLSAIIQYATNGAIPIALAFGTVNFILLVVAVKTLGWRTCFRSIFGVASLTLWLAIIPEYADNAVNAIIPDGEDFMASFIGGLLCGLGIGIVFINNGTSGGTDIMAMVVNKYRHISLGRSLFYCDVLIICSSYFLPENNHHFYPIIYGLVMMTVSSYTVDMVMNGMRQSVQFFIFSTKYEDIANAINSEMKRGVTLLDGTGWYSKAPIKVVTVLARKNESAKIFKLIRRIDKNAFVS